MKTKIFTSFIILSFFISYRLIAQIDAGFKTGNALEISKYLNHIVAVDLLGELSESSSLETVNLLEDFFKENNPEHFIIVHQGRTPAGISYSVGELKTAQKTFIINYYIKNEGGMDLIVELSISEK